MIRSMTGYGKHEESLESGRIIVEVRSVNHRYGEVFVKLPRPMLALENEVRKIVAEQLKRGKIEVYIQQEGVAGAAGAPTVNLPLAKAYHEAYTRMAQALGINDHVPLSLIAAQKDLLILDEGGSRVEDVQEALFSAVRGAVANLDAMRLREGSSLLDDLQSRRQTLSNLIGRISDRAPSAVDENASRFRTRVRQIAGESGVDDARLAQEIAIMADRWDISEELVRFNSHLKQFDDTMAMEEAIGRRLDFLLQELNREVNTIGSKANDAEITSLIVELKAELERIREQVQNIE